MIYEDAIRLEQHIQGDMPGWNPQAAQIGNGEWVIKLVTGKYVWDIEDWNTNFVGKPVQQEVQVNG